MNPGTIFIIASLLATATCSIIAIAASEQNKRMMLLARRTYYFTSFTIAGAFLILLGAFLFQRYDFVYVFNNSSSELPLHYRIAAVWAGKEGSFLLWLLFLNAAGLIAIRNDDASFKWLCAVISLTQFFILIMLVNENPFTYIWNKHPDEFMKGVIPQDGSGLNPLLLDPWMVAHPPVLFLGYATSTIPFAYAVHALMMRDWDAWSTRVARWALFSMTTLGIGIFLGGYWAYTVLGWGGYWGWDPVENSSLIPWLVVIALVHGLVLQSKSRNFYILNVILALLYHILVIFSAFLTRSGVLADFSVHSFGRSEISIYLLLFLGVFFLGAIAIAFTNMPHMKKISNQPDIPVMDWRFMTIVGIAIILLFSGVVLLGTVMPIVTGWFSKNKSSVNTLFFYYFSIPVSILVCGAIAIATRLMASRKSFMPKDAIIIVVSIICAVVLNITHTGFVPFYIITFFALVTALYSVSDMIVLGKRTTPSRLTHLGISLFIIGSITANFHISNETITLEKDVPYSSRLMSISFKGLKEGAKDRLVFERQAGTQRKEVSTLYYIDQKSGSLYREPIVIFTPTGDYYIAPDQYVNGMASVTRGTLVKGDEQTIGGLRVKFNEFTTEHMTSGEPSIYADLSINGAKVMPGLKIVKGETLPIRGKVPGTRREVILLGINARTKIIDLYIAPEDATAIPPDKVIVSLGYKRLIILVWLGTLLVSVGGAVAFINALRQGKPVR